VAKKLEETLQESPHADVKKLVQEEMNEFLPIVGIKRKVDSQKKKILIGHTKKDKVLADVIYKMLSFNGVPDDEIIYTNCDNAECRIPEGADIFDYLRNFFVDSYSNEKIYVIYVTSEDMSRSWGAVSEVGAGRITRSNHKVFNVHGHTPQRPLDTDVEWQTSKRDGDAVKMDAVEFDKFVVKIMDVCTSLGYPTKSKNDNEQELRRYVTA
jgi:hypothetical protein